MKLLRPRVTYANVVATLALVFAVGGGAVASGALSSEEKITGCLSEAGRITVVAAKTVCASGETPISWNKTGPVGKRGLRGFTGRKGDEGRRGRTGDVGPAGKAGAAGAGGRAGVAGPAGADGKTGATGPEGPKGDACPSSDAACIGEKGDTGATGDTGPAGPKGDACLSADVACVGAKGDTGATGATGPQGFEGDEGETGPTGATGAQGPRGDACLSTVPECVGPKGEPGTNGTGTPAGAVMNFNLRTCPDGWSEFAAAQGRYVVGLRPGGTLAGVQGTALSDLESRAVGRHAHNVYGQYSVPTFGSQDIGQGGVNQRPFPFYGFFDGGYQTASLFNGYTDSAGVDGTNAPYIQLLSCQKD